MNAAENKDTATPRAKRAWQRPTVTAAGSLSAVLRGGNGKVTVTTGDPGEPQKVPATDK